MPENIQIDETNKNADKGLGICGLILVAFSIALLVITMPLSFLYTIRIVKEYERAVILRLGRVLPGGAKGPGLFFILPCIDKIVKVDLRTITFNVPPQEILTKDSVTVTVDAVCFFRIINPVDSVMNVENSQYATKHLSAATLRNILGTKTLQQILQDKESLTLSMQEALAHSSVHWGIKIERVELKDVRLPTSMQRAMATEAEATREAYAKVIATEGEKKASLALKEAANIISQSPLAMQLRYLQTLTAISAEKNSTIIFPIPMEMFRK